MHRILAVAVILIMFPWPSAAQNKKRLPVKINGFLLGNLTLRSSGERPPNGEGGAFVLGEERLRLDASAASKAGSVFFLLKGELFHDGIANRVDADLREGYLGYRSGPIDLRVGRQILTWGVGDLFFINDVFPKDWESFFSGRPMEYLKRGIDALRLQYSSDVLNLDLVATPSFRPDALPSPKRFFLYNPFPGAVGPREVRPAVRTENLEVALRAYRRVGGFDVSVYGYRGFYRTPGLRTGSIGEVPQVTQFYPPLIELGASAQANSLGGVVSLEGGHYDSRADRNGTDPSIPNSQWRALVGYQRQIRRELTVNLQAYTEIMSQYDAYRRFLPPQAPSQDQVHTVFSARLTQFLNYQNWRISVLLAHSPTDSDYFLQPEVSHRLTDRLSATLGATMFGGRRDSTFFGQMQKDDSVYVNARFDF